MFEGRDNHPDLIVKEKSRPTEQAGCFLRWAASITLVIDYSEILMNLQLHLQIVHPHFQLQIIVHPRFQYNNLRFGIGRSDSQFGFMGRDEIDGGGTLNWSWTRQNIGSRNLLLLENMLDEIENITFLNRLIFGVGNITKSIHIKKRFSLILDVKKWIHHHRVWSLILHLKGKGIQVVLTMNITVVKGQSQDTSSEFLKAIEESHTYLVVISTNYSRSVESLDELVLIMDSLPKFKNRKVIPVFLNVDPSDVRNLRGCFEEAFRMHEANIDPNRVRKWRKALKEAGQRSGQPLKNGDDEAAFLHNIIQDLKKIKIPLELFDAQHPVGIEPRAQAIISALRLGDLDFHNIVAVFGISGSGKTTIVQAVYDRIVADFDYYCFIKNIHFYKNKGPFWEVELQREVLRGLTGNDPTHGNVGAPEIRRLIDSEKTLLVLDDVEKVDDLKALGLHSASLSSGSGSSRVIVTTRNKGSLGNLPYTCYDIELLDWEESFELFVRYAYGEDEPVDAMFVHEIVCHAGGLPLILNVWGLHFKAHKKEEWPNLLKTMRRIPHEDIQQKLQVSYDSLPDETKSFFLDIVFFFDGWSWDYTKSYEDTYMEMTDYMYMYQHSMCRLLHDEDELFFREIKIKPLVDRGLVKIENEKVRLVIHEVIREMGKEVVRQQNTKEPGKRTRLVDERDVLHVVKNNSGTSSVESIILEIDYEKSEEQQSIKNVIGAFKKMNNLRFIKFVGNLSFPLETYQPCSDDDKPIISMPLSFKQLKYLEWQSFPWRSINNLDMPNVVVIVLRYSKLEILWDGIKNLNLKKLRILDVYESESLTMTGSFIGLQNLEELYFNSCLNLKEVDSSIICLDKLHTLNISNCENIKSIPNLPPSIKLLLAGGCENLVNLPKNMSELQSLRILDLDRCSNLVSEGLIRVTRLRKLQHLYTINSNVSQVSSETGNFESLQKLYLRGNNFSSLPDSLSNLSQLVLLDISCCDELRYLPLLPSKLTLIEATGCSSLDVMPFDPSQKANVFRSKLFEESFIAKALWIDLTHTMVPEVFQYKGDRGQVLSFVAPEKKIYGAILYVSRFSYLKSLGLRNRTKEKSYEFENPKKQEYNFAREVIIICPLNETTLVVEAGDTVEVICDDDQSYGFRFIYEGDVVVDSTTLAIQNTIIDVNATHENTSSVPSEMN
ncbi:disease resistance protein RML1A-like [Rutidosis leptorrhynchoides]|uniref:disease resistance protein RML1A-like n=1 Tax=Rutidosis leptorrhynchoides TaxID=125765 RepID=UPI003A995FCF